VGLDRLGTTEEDFDGPLVGVLRVVGTQAEAACHAEQRGLVLGDYGLYEIVRSGPRTHGVGRHSW
jgi:hypothetical protein